MNGAAAMRCNAEAEATRALGLEERRRHARQLFFGMFLMLAVLLPPMVARAQATPPTEYQVKAAFLFNFAKFTEWPADSFANSESPFLVCVLGKDPFGRMLDDTLQGKTILEHPIVVDRLRDAAGARNCQLVFVGRSEAVRLTAVLEALRGSSALVVGETDGFARFGGAIELILEEDRVGFIINPDAAGRAGLRLSSKLLALAKIVHDDPGNKKS